MALLMKLNHGLSKASDGKLKAALREHRLALEDDTRELLAEVAVLEEEVVHLEDYVLFLQEDLQSESRLIAEMEKQKHQSAYRNPGQHFIPGDGPKPIRHIVVARSLLDSVEDEPHTDSRRGSQLSPSRKLPQKLMNSEKQAAIQSRAASPSALDFKEVQRGKENHHKTNKFSDRWPQSSKVNSMSPSKNRLPSRAPAIDKEDDLKGLSGIKPHSSLTFRLTSVTQKTEANRLSEEMMKCLLSIYCIITSPEPLPESATSSAVSGSILSSFNSKRSIIRTKTKSEMHYELFDPYFEYGERVSEPGPYKSFQSINANSFDYTRIADSASKLSTLRIMVESLGTIDLEGMSHQQKLAFWINIYNICMMHGFLEFGIPESPHQVMALMHKAVLNVGGYLVNALAIEHFILRSPCHSKHAFADILCKEMDNMQSGLGLESPEPMACFALCCGSYSSPAVRVYTPSEIEGELEIAKRDYLQAAVGVTTRQTVAIPKLLDWNTPDIAEDAASLVNWIFQQIPVSLQKALQECTNRANGIISRALEVMPYDFTFRYLLA